MKSIRIFLAIAAVSLPSVVMTKSSVVADWPMWGGSPDRNMVSEAKPVSLEFDLESGDNVAWTKNLGTQTYGNPVVADGKVFVGTNNGAGYRPKHPKTEDRGVLICFNQNDGEFLWQLTREKLSQGRVNDWPEQGICSTPVVEGNRLWVVTNRCELMCLDTNGFHDDENDGDVQDEADAEKGDADIVWNLDMIEELGVFPHNLATSSPVIHGDLVFILTSNGVDEAHLEVPSPRAPCFLAVNKNTGEVVWEQNQPFDLILHGQWSSPAIGEVNGKTQVYFPGGDGWLYALDPESGEEIWKFDLNPKDTSWELGGKGTRNAIIATPVFYDNSVLLAVGQDPEHGEGVGHFYRIDATKKGDVSPTLGDIGSPGKPNPNSAQIWHYGGEIEDENGNSTLKFRRTMSTASIEDGMVFIADLSGFVHCIDFETGERHWEYDMLSGVWGSTLVADGKVFLGNEDGTLTVFKASKEKAEVLAEKTTVNYSSIYSTPTFSDGKMYLSDRTRLYAVNVSDVSDSNDNADAAGSSNGTAVTDEELPQLTIGSQAPELDIEYWYSKGDGRFETITDFEEDKIYIIEFWATWCGPCIASMPILAELQEEYFDQGVQLISVSDEDDETIKAFLERDVRGGTGTYEELTNAYCLTSDPDGSVKDDYFHAAGQVGIPCAFIVGRTGKIEWIGHPAQMREPLDEVVEGTWDREEFAKSFKLEQRRDLLSCKLRTITNLKKYDEGLELINSSRKRFKDDPTTLALLEKVEASIHVQQAIKKFEDGNEREAIEELETIVDRLDGITRARATEALLNMMFATERFDSVVEQLNKMKEDGTPAPLLTLVSIGIRKYSKENEVPKEVISAARKIAEKSVKEMSENIVVLNNCARLRHLDGDLEGAIKMAEKAAEVNDGKYAFLDQLKQEKQNASDADTDSKEE